MGRRAEINGVQTSNQNLNKTIKLQVENTVM